MPSIETVLVCTAIILNPMHHYAIYFDATSNLMFVMIISLSALQSNRIQVIITSATTAISHLIVALIYYPEFLKSHAKSDLLTLINGWEFVWFSVYICVIGYMVAQKTREGEAMTLDMRNVWIPKIVGGAYRDLMSSNGVADIETPYYSIFSETTFSEKFVGGDFYRVDIRGDNIMMVVGDVVSHGMNVSQGAIACLSAFQAMPSTDPKDIITAINSVLLPIKSEHGGETIAIALCLQTDGTIVYNGYAEKFTLMRSRNDILETEDPEMAGILLGKNSNFTPSENKTLKLEIGDSLVILTDGAANNDHEDDKTSVVLTYYGGIKIPGLEQNEPQQSGYEIPSPWDVNPDSPHAPADVHK